LGVIGINLRESKQRLNAGDIHITLADNFIVEIEQRCDQLLSENTGFSIGGSAGSILAIFYDGSACVHCYHFSVNTKQEKQCN
jgi:hypothetical protein